MYCTTCNKQREDVFKLVAWIDITLDKNLAICDECIDACKNVLDREKGQPIEKLKSQIAIDALDELQRAISVRNVEMSQTAYKNKLDRPHHLDLNWVIDQIYFIKQTL